MSTRSGYAVCMNHQSEDFLSLHPLHHGFCRNNAWIWSSKGAPYTSALLDSLWKSGKSCSDNSTSIFLASFAHLLTKVGGFFSPSITSTKKIWPPISCSLPAVSLSCLAETKGHFFQPCSCTWKAEALEALQGLKVSVPCWAVAGSSQPRADVEHERSQGRPVWFSKDGQGPMADPWATGIFKGVSLNKIHSSCRLLSHL